MSPTTQTIASQHKQMITSNGTGVLLGNYFSSDAGTDHKGKQASVGFNFLQIR